MHKLADVDHVSWYLIQTKPRQEFRALEQLENQGYTCFLPNLQVEKLVTGKLHLCIEPLFARYMFIQLNTTKSNWSPIRSTRGVSKLVEFGGRLATLSEECIQTLRERHFGQPKRMFAAGDRVAVSNGPFAGLEGIYEMPDGEARAMVLIELMSQPQKLSFAVTALRKVA
jgi:transcriptional antiterminator RfaH